MQLQDSVVKLKGVGEKTEKILQKLEIVTLLNLLEHYPRGYDVYGDLVPIHCVREGDIAAIQASVVKTATSKKIRNLQIITCQVKDHSGELSLTWFNMPFLRNTLRMGTYFIFRGKVVRKNGNLVLEQPQILTKEEFYNKRNVLQPVYPLTAGITNNAISKAVKQLLSEVELIQDYLPQSIRKEHNLITYRASRMEIHFPKSKENMLEARKRIVFDEFFLFTLALNQLKEQKGTVTSSYVLNRQESCQKLIDSLPYALTGAQKNVWDEIQKDLTNGLVMNRLVQGDVGSGKTILAVLSMLMAACSGYQSALMVPTEVLAKQHYETLSELMQPYGIPVLLLVGSMTAKEKRIAYEEIKFQENAIVIGTHALIQEKAEYNNLALVITDEQHRFGVRQREALSEKGREPHILVMSATPIPRTLAIILYGELDISVVDELPANRLPIKNCVVDTNYRDTAYRFIQKEVQAGRQAYVICPMVEESETIEAENVIEYTEKLRDALPVDTAIAYLHGKMKAREKNEIMEAFASGEIQVLVSTTVVEVGVNVPNATVMMIENAERFGLAQLHQLRGRVGRGGHQSYCILVSGSNSDETRERLEILNHSNDGFLIASEDLKLRGPGDMFGIKQSGLMEFKMGDIFQDALILKEANEAAKKITKNDMEKLLNKYPLLHEKINLYSGNTLL